MPSTTETASACEPCSSLPKILSGEAPDAVAELPTGVVVIGYHQFFHGYSLFIAKTHATELHLLPAEECQRFLWEMTLVSAAVALAFKPRKMNIDVLGNLHPHVHAHLFPRHAGDPMPKGPVWEIPKAIREHAGTRAAPERLTELRLMLQTALVHVFKNCGEPVKNIRLIHPKLSPSPSPPGDVFLLNGNENPDTRSGPFLRPTRCGSASGGTDIFPPTLPAEAPPGSSDRSAGYAHGSHRRTRGRRPGTGS